MTTVSDTEPPVTELATERWSAAYADITAAGDGVHVGHVGIARHFDGGDTDVFPVSVRVTLLGAWASCVIDPASWQGEVSPSEHPYFDAREWSLQLESAEITPDPDGDAASVAIVHTVVSGDDTAALTLTAQTEPGCGTADEAAQTGGEQAAEQSAAAGDDQAKAGDDIEGKTGEQGEQEPITTEPEPEEEIGLKVVDVQLRRWNHQALIDLPLWSHCPPEQWTSTLIARLDRYLGVWDGWDSEVVELEGYHIASGWWTDEQLDMWLPGAGVTAQMAREHANYHPIMDTVGLWPDTMAPTSMNVEAPEHLPTLKAAMEHRGHDPHAPLSVLLRATRDGIAGSGAWPDDVHVGLLLTDWMRWRSSRPPTIHEPVAWPLRSLFQARESTCVGEALIEMCASDDTPSPVLASDHPIGRVLRSLACGE